MLAMMEPADSLQIDGSLLEGGGQILRNATALSAITGRDILVDKIRAGRKTPGLSPQHLTGLQLIANITGGKLEGGAIRSTRISFSPGPAPAQVSAYTADTKTAGSCTLLVQQALPVLLFAAGGDDGEGSSSGVHRPSKRCKAGSSSSSCLTLKGGTDAAFAPPIGYLQHVFLPTLQRLIAPLAADLSLDVQRRGFYPKGGGQVQLNVPALPTGTALPAWDLTERGHLVHISGFAVTAGKLRPDICQRMARSAKKDLQAALKDSTVLFGAAYTQHHNSKLCEGSPVAPTAADASHSTPQQQQQGGGAATSSSHSHRCDSIPSVVIDIQAIHEPPEQAMGDGGSIVLVAETSTGCLLGASALAERGVSAEAVGAMAARDLLEELRSGAAADSWMQDQLIIFMSLASGRSRLLCAQPTLHTRTAMSIAEQLLPGVQFDVVTAIGPDARAAGSSSTEGGQSLYLISCTGSGAVGHHTEQS